MKLPRRIDMTTTRAEIRRLLPAAVEHAPFVEEEAAFVHRGAGRSWRIAVTPLPRLEIGLIRLERQRLEFEFNGYSEAEIDAFLSRFEVYFRRGGG